MQVRLTYSPAATRPTTGSICTPTSADKILRKAFERADIEGASTHSFRRTALSQMSNARIPLRIIQEISGHNNLEQLQREERGGAGSSQRSDRLSFHAFLQEEMPFIPTLSCWVATNKIGDMLSLMHRRGIDLPHGGSPTNVTCCH
jgi:hypothetical protein